VSSTGLEDADPAEVDRPDLVTEDDRVERLTGVTGRDRDLGRVPGSPGGDRADRRHAGSMERVVRHDQCSTHPCLLMPDGRVEVDLDDATAHDRAHLTPATIHAVEVSGDLPDLGGIQKC
jgi:hypothetical protein